MKKPKPTSETHLQLSEDLQELFGFSQRQADVISVHHYDQAIYLIADLYEVANQVHYLKEFYKELK